MVVALALTIHTIRIERVHSFEESLPNGVLLGDSHFENYFAALTSSTIKALPLNYASAPRLLMITVRRSRRPCVQHLDFSEHMNRKREGICQIINKSNF